MSRKLLLGQAREDFPHVRHILEKETEIPNEVEYPDTGDFAEQQAEDTQKRSWRIKSHAY